MYIYIYIYIYGYIISCKTHSMKIHWVANSIDVRVHDDRFIDLSKQARNL